MESIAKFLKGQGATSHTYFEYSHPILATSGLLIHVGTPGRVNLGSHIIKLAPGTDSLRKPRIRLQNAHTQVTGRMLDKMLCESHPGQFKLCLGHLDSREKTKPQVNAKGVKLTDDKLKTASPQFLIVMPNNPEGKANLQKLSQALSKANVPKRSLKKLNDVARVDVGKNTSRIPRVA